MQYKAKKGIFVIIMTTFIFGLIVWFIKLAIDSIEKGTTDYYTLILAAIFIFILAIIRYLLAPRQYIIDETQLIVKRFWKDVHINLSDISNILSIPNSESWKFVRSLGIGGVFSNVGKFYHMKYKYVTFNATRNTNLVLIETRDKDYAISPNGTDFIEQLEKKINE